MCGVLGIRLRPSGPMPPPGGIFVCPNHLGYVDVFVLASLYRGLFVSRADVARWPIVGPFARAGGTLFIDRESRRDSARVGEAIERHLRLRCRVTAFLEGGSGRGDEVRPFRSPLLEAAAAARAPCVPAAIRYLLPRDPDVDSGSVVAWSDGTPIQRHLWRLLHLRRIEARVVFGAPRTGDDRKALARALEEDVRRLLSAALSEA